MSIVRIARHKGFFGSGLIVWEACCGVGLSRFKGKTLVEEIDPTSLAVELVSAIHKDCSIRGRRGSMVVKKT